MHQSKYAVGDEFNEDGVEGIVGYIGDSVRYVCKTLGSHYWSTKYELTNATSRTDGEYNMNQIKKIPHWEELYPAFFVCDQLNTDGITGWYLPAIDEIKKETRYACGYEMWSSTQSDEVSECWAYTACPDTKGVHIYNEGKINNYRVVAFHKF